MHSKLKPRSATTTLSPPLHVADTDVRAFCAEAGVENTQASSAVAAAM
jgi:hypothetical protein